MIDLTPELLAAADRYSRWLAGQPVTVIYGQPRRKVADLLLRDDMANLAMHLTRWLVMGKHVRHYFLSDEPGDMIGE